MLKIKNLHVEVNKKGILKGVSLEVRAGELHALMGPNGAGKTTLAQSLIKSSKFKIQSSQLTVDGKDISKLKTENVIKKGLFISFQQPTEIKGISNFSFLRNAYKSIFPKEKISVAEFKDLIKKAFKNVGLSEDFIYRSVNEGFSGGEKKKMEIAHLSILKPKYAILDEVDSGLDIDSIKRIAKLISNMIKNKTGIIFITHNPRIFNFMKPDFIHFLKEGKIKKTGNFSLIKEIEERGYAKI